MWAIILHGGAKEIEPEEAEANRAGCLRVLSAGRAALRVLEDDRPPTAPMAAN